MKRRLTIAALVLAIALAAFPYMLRQLSLLSVALSANGESQTIIRQSLEDQKKLSRLDPANAPRYRERFETMSTLLRRLEIIALTHRNVTRQFEIILGSMMVLILVSGVVAFAVQHRSREKRRLQSLEHLASWQEAARRHAHEMRTPLTAAQLELSRLVRWVEARLPADGELHEREASIIEELEHLRRFTHNFVAFAAVGEPQLQLEDISKLVADFCTTFAPNWPGVSLHYEETHAHLFANTDREMLRRVLMNLCNNSALALASGGGNIRFATGSADGNVLIDVRDDGPGVPPAIRGRLFEPYTTTRKIGEGMGLGLAISKKIMLDHGGDIVLLRSSSGAAFRLTLPSGGER